MAASLDDTGGNRANPRFAGPSEMTYSGGAGLACDRRDARRPGHTALAANWPAFCRLRSSFFVLVVCAAAALGCVPSGGDGLRRLPIAPAEAATAYTPEQAAVLDAGLTASVKLRLLFDREVSARRINVDTRDRLVTLRGVAGTDAERARALRIARETHGVACVVDQLTVRMSGAV